jgi:hypothetical protein
VRSGCSRTRVGEVWGSCWELWYRRTGLFRFVHVAVAPLRVSESTTPRDLWEPGTVRRKPLAAFFFFFFSCFITRAGINLHPHYRRWPLVLATKATWADKSEISERSSVFVTFCITPLRAKSCFGQTGKVQIFQCLTWWSYHPQHSYAKQVN